MVIFFVEFFGLVYDWVSFKFWIFGLVKNLGRFIIQGVCV